ncbi:hypothetical protein PVK06_024944 [Gossypium arboreum]|uniref:Uncharacterized protein n=1 Tax=Gossypium arboreum TaxID=29729 RepID=A0ABR0PFH9_GOSAR|nr:hypothetical protein PVK06_024944 [Gossypium arboreum]
MLDEQNRAVMDRHRLVEVSDDIDNKCADNDLYATSVPTYGIVIHNDPEIHMLSVGPDVAYASEFLEYQNIIHSLWLVVDSELEELFVSQQFASKECHIPKIGLEEIGLVN